LRPYENHKGGSVDVHAFYFYKTAKEPKDDRSMIIQVIAENVWEPLEKAKEQLAVLGEKPDEWRAMLQTTTKVYFTATGEQENKLKPINNYITDLLYVKDEFASTPHEKGVITKIINNIKEKHAN
jgi:hypothetical protein